MLLLNVIEDTEYDFFHKTTAFADTTFSGFGKMGFGETGFGEMGLNQI